MNCCQPVIQKICKFVFIFTYFACESFYIYGISDNSYLKFLKVIGLMCLGIYTLLDVSKGEKKCNCEANKCGNIMKIEPNEISENEIKELAFRISIILRIIYFVLKKLDEDKNNSGENSKLNEVYDDIKKNYNNSVNILANNS